jgi:hypothetical protein
MTDSIPRQPRGPHPTPEQLYAARRGPRDAAAERILAHAFGCALCSQELARQEAFDQPEPLLAGALEDAWRRFGAAELPATARSSARRTPVLALAAALMVCALGLGLWVARQRPAELDVERSDGRNGSEGWEGRDGEIAVDRQPAGELAAPPEAFVLSSPAGEPRRVKVFDETQSYTWTSAPAVGGRIDFPETERRRLRPGVTYYWLVLGGDEQSAARSFRIVIPHRQLY